MLIRERCHKRTASVLFSIASSIIAVPIMTGYRLRVKHSGDDSMRPTVKQMYTKLPDVSPRQNNFAHRIGPCIFLQRVQAQNSQQWADSRVEKDVTGTPCIPSHFHAVMITITTLHLFPSPRILNVTILQTNHQIHVHTNCTGFCSHHSNQM